jgi:acyl dehydratase
VAARRAARRRAARRGEVLEVRASSSRPGFDFIKCRTTTLNQNGEPVQVLVMNLLVRRKEGGT